MSLGKFNLALTGLDPRKAVIKEKPKKVSLKRKNLTKEQASEIRSYFEKHYNGENQTLLCASLAVKYDKGETTIRSIIKNKSHV